MSLVIFQDCSLQLGGKAIVENLDLRIAEGERIGLIGPNGSGKSSLLKLLSGQYKPDGGSVIVPRDVRIGYLPQDVELESEKTLLDYVLSSVPGREEISRAIEETTAKLERRALEGADEEELTELGVSVGALHEELLHFETHYSEHEAKTILAGLGFLSSDLDRSLSEFSGGWKMRAVLTALLYQRPDLLLLDEPTNHLDMPSVGWFSGFLKRYPRAIVMISHDREFLNEQIERVLSFEPEGLRTYQGNLDRYKKQRDEERVLLEARAKNIQREKEHLEKFIDRFGAKATKATQAQSRVKRLEKLEEVKLLEEHEAMSFRFQSVEKSGRDVIVAEGLEKSFGDKNVFRGVDLRVNRGDRIALIGKNGAGKTTLLRILAGELEKNAGEVRYGHNVKLGYYAQHHAEILDPSRSVYDTINEISKNGHREVRAALGALLFRDDDVDKKIGVLSGGERARVALARLLVDPGNVLLMDEPTNHLDLDSSDRLADALRGYDGTLLFVSHNRAFIRAIATSIWTVEDGALSIYPGTFDEYLESFQAKQEPEQAASKSNAKEASTERAANGSSAIKTSAADSQAKRRNDRAERRAEAEKRKKRNQILGPLERRSEELVKKIDAAEKEIATLSRELEDPALYEDEARRSSVMDAIHKKQVELEILQETWMEVEAELEEKKAEFV